jgi:Ca2+/H+ antiporter, TMEM165/GDT1 family
VCSMDSFLSLSADSNLSALVNSFLLVFVGEMGDKTQLLALLLAARYRQPWVILSGVFVATILNHALASWAGGFLASYFDPTVLKWALAILFFGFAIWILIPDKEEELKATGRFGAFLTTVVAFFLAEMGDKTQLATVALGARFSQVWIVTLGTTMGMMASNALAIFLGEKLLKRIPMKWVRVFASALFFLFGIGILVF